MVCAHALAPQGRSTSFQPPLLSPRLCVPLPGAVGALRPRIQPRRHLVFIRMSSSVSKEPMSDPKPHPISKSFNQIAGITALALATLAATVLRDRITSPIIPPLIPKIATVLPECSHDPARYGQLNAAAAVVATEAPTNLKASPTVTGAAAVDTAFTAAARRPVAGSVVRSVVRPMWATATLPLRVLDLMLFPDTELIRPLPSVAATTKQQPVATAAPHVPAAAAPAAAATAVVSFNSGNTAGVEATSSSSSTAICGVEAVAEQHIQSAARTAQAVLLQLQYLLLTGSTVVVQQLQQTVAQLTTAHHSTYTGSTNVNHTSSSGSSSSLATSDVGADGWTPPVSPSAAAAAAPLPGASAEALPAGSLGLVGVLAATATATSAAVVLVAVMAAAAASSSNSAGNGHSTDLTQQMPIPCYTWPGHMHHLPDIAHDLRPRSGSLSSSSGGGDAGGNSASERATVASAARAKTASTAKAAVGHEQLLSQLPIACYNLPDHISNKLTLEHGHYDRPHTAITGRGSNGGVNPSTTEAPVPKDQVDYDALLSQLPIVCYNTPDHMPNPLTLQFGHYTRPRGDSASNSSGGNGVADAAAAEISTIAAIGAVVAGPGSTGCCSSSSSKFVAGSGAAPVNSSSPRKDEEQWSFAKLAALRLYPLSKHPPTGSISRTIAAPVPAAGCDGSTEVTAVDDSSSAVLAAAEAAAPMLAVASAAADSGVTEDAGVDATFDSAAHAAMDAVVDATVVSSASASSSKAADAAELQTAAKGGEEVWRLVALKHNSTHKAEASTGRADGVEAAAAVTDTSAAPAASTAAATAMATASGIAAATTGIAEKSCPAMASAADVPDVLDACAAGGTEPGDGTEPSCAQLQQDEPGEWEEEEVWHLVATKDPLHGGNNPNTLSNRPTEHSSLQEALSAAASSALLQLNMTAEQPGVFAEHSTSSSSSSSQAGTVEATAVAANAAAADSVIDAAYAVEYADSCPSAFYTAFDSLDIESAGEFVQAAAGADMRNSGSSGDVVGEVRALLGLPNVDLSVACSSPEASQLVLLLCQALLLRGDESEAKLAAAMKHLVDSKHGALLPVMLAGALQGVFRPTDWQSPSGSAVLMLRVLGTALPSASYTVLQQQLLTRGLIHEVEVPCSFESQGRTNNASSSSSSNTAGASAGAPAAEAAAAAAAGMAAEHSAGAGAERPDGAGVLPAAVAGITVVTAADIGLQATADAPAVRVDHSAAESELTAAEVPAVNPADAALLKARAALAEAQPKAMCTEQYVYEAQAATTTACHAADAAATEPVRDCLTALGLQDAQDAGRYAAAGADLAYHKAKCVVDSGDWASEAADGAAAAADATVAAANAAVAAGMAQQSQAEEWIAQAESYAAREEDAVGEAQVVAAQAEAAGTAEETALQFMIEIAAGADMPRECSAAVAFEVPCGAAETTADGVQATEAISLRAAGAAAAAAAATAAEHNAAVTAAKLTAAAAVPAALAEVLLPTADLITAHAASTALIAAQRDAVATVVTRTVAKASNARNEAAELPGARAALAESSLHLVHAQQWVLEAHEAVKAQRNAAGAALEDFGRDELAICCQAVRQDAAVDTTTDCAEKVSKLSYQAAVEASVADAVQSAAAVATAGAPAAVGLVQESEAFYCMSKVEEPAESAENASSNVDLTLMDAGEAGADAAEATAERLTGMESPDEMDEKPYEAVHDSASQAYEAVCDAHEPAHKELKGACEANDEVYMFEGAKNAPAWAAHAAAATAAADTATAPGASKEAAAAIVAAATAATQRSENKNDAFVSTAVADDDDDTATSLNDISTAVDLSQVASDSRGELGLSRMQHKMSQLLKQLNEVESLAIAKSRELLPRDSHMAHTEACKGCWDVVQQAATSQQQLQEEEEATEPQKLESGDDMHVGSWWKPQQQHFSAAPQLPSVADMLENELSWSDQWLYGSMGSGSSSGWAKEQQKRKSGKNKKGGKNKKKQRAPHAMKKLRAQQAEAQQQQGGSKSVDFFEFSLPSLIPECCGQLEQPSQPKGVDCHAFASPDDQWWQQQLQQEQEWVDFAGLSDRKYTDLM